MDGHPANGVRRNQEKELDIAVRVHWLGQRHHDSASSVLIAFRSPSDFVPRLLSSHSCPEALAPLCLGHWKLPLEAVWGRTAMIPAGGSAKGWARRKDWRECSYIKLVREIMMVSTLQRMLWKLTKIIMLNNQMIISNPPSTDSCLNSNSSPTNDPSRSDQKPDPEATVLVILAAFFQIGVLLDQLLDKFLIANTSRLVQPDDTTA